MPCRIERPVRCFGEQIGSDGQPQDPVKARRADRTHQRDTDQSAKPPVLLLQQEQKTTDQAELLNPTQHRKR